MITLIIERLIKIYLLATKKEYSILNSKYHWKSFSIFVMKNESIFTSSIKINDVLNK